MSTTIMHHFEDTDLKYLGCTHSDQGGSFSINVAQPKGIDLWLSAPVNVGGYEKSYRWLTAMLDDMKNRLTEEYLSWKQKEGK